MALFGRKKKDSVTEAPEEVVETLPDAPEPRADGRRTLSAHRDYLLSLVEPLPPFGMQTLDAVGLALCEDLSADQDIPAVDVAAVDGYAVRCGDVVQAAQDHPVTLPVAARLSLGEQVSAEVPAGVCVRVVAGSPMPEGTAAVVPDADADDDGHDVRLRLSAQPGQYVRAKGSDIMTGETLLRESEPLTSRIVGMLAGAGIDRVMARPRPRVVVMATGAELVEPGQRLRVDSDTYDVNSYLLAAAARAEGAQVYRVGAYTRDAAELKEAITDQLIRADLIITTGGVSHDDVDLVKSVMPQLGRCDFAEVAMNPGRRQGFGLVGPDEVPLVMLPGDPMSAYVSYQVFVRPLIRQLMGARPTIPTTVRAVTQSMVRSAVGETAFVLGRLRMEAGGRRLVDPLVGHNEHQLGELAQANCLIVLSEETETVSAGSSVLVLPLDGD